jgi:hypothetical protein
VKVAGSTGRVIATVGKTPRLYTARRRRRIKYQPPSPLTETLRIIGRRIDRLLEDAKSVKAFRKSLRDCCEDDALWKQVEDLRKAVEQLKCTIDDLGLSE